MAGIVAALLAQGQGRLAPMPLPILPVGPSPRRTGAAVRGHGHPLPHRADHRAARRKAKARARLRRRGA
jgi:hypothetical protein